MPKTPFDHGESGLRVESESDLVQTYLAPLAAGMPGAFGLRDDAAVLPNERGSDLVFSSDPIVAGVHFFADDQPPDIAWKALAVNVSDVAAKGAQPVAYILNLALPEAPKRTWMADFARGLAEAQAAFGCRLIGGDTDRTPGPLSIGITMIASLPSGTFVPRHAAKPGDHVFVTGTIGDAALGLALRRDSSLFDAALTDPDRNFLLGRYLRPQPRIALAESLRAHARAALDISDGLLKDLARLAEPGGMALRFDAVPLSTATRAALSADRRLIDKILGGGGDYELLVAVAPSEASAFQESAQRAAVEVHDLGILEGSKVVVLDASGTELEFAKSGYDHFSR
jgi:thiamine-monophosphate kinase